MEESVKYEKEKMVKEAPKKKRVGGLSERLLRMIRQKEKFLKERKKEKQKNMKAINEERNKDFLKKLVEIIKT